MTRPSAIALIVCDSIYRDATGKVALVGLFNQIVVRRLPAIHAQLCVYVSVTDIHPGTRFRLVIEHGETQAQVAASEGPPLEGVNPAAVLELHFDLKNVPFPEPGTYFVQFWANDHILLQRPFDVIEEKNRGQP